MKRFRVVAAAAAAISALCAMAAPPASSQDLTELKFSFLSRPSGSVSNFVAGIDGGFFKREGLDVAVVIPGNPADGMKLVVAGTVQVGIAHSTDVILARSRGLPVVSLGATHQYGTAGVMVPAEANVQTPKDLSGKKIGITGIPANRVMLVHMLRTSGVDLGSVSLVNVGFTLAPALLEGRIDAIGDAITWSEPITYNLAKGLDANDDSSYVFMPFYKNGVPRYYTFTMITSEETLKARPDDIRAFLRGWAKSIEWSVEHPDEAADMLVKRYPQIKRAVGLGQWKVLTKLVTSPETEAHGIGWQDPKVWQTQAAFMRQYGLIKTDVDISKAMTNDYLPGK